MENKATIIGLIAVIIGTSGLGLAAYTLFGPLGHLDENPQYFCSSHAAVQDAIGDIGSGSGTIIITENITLTDTIDVNQGGNYIIEGDGSITISCGTNRTAFNITDVEALIIQDLAIDGSSLSTATLDIMLIDDANDNPVIIQNVHIDGEGLGHGMEIRSDNVRVHDCHLTALERGIQLNGSGNSWITGNMIENLNGSIDGRGIILEDTENNTITGNIIDNIDGVDDAMGITLLNANNNAIADNMIINLNGTDDAFGIFMTGEHNTIHGNRFMNFNPIDDAFGIDMPIGSEYNVISSNTFMNIDTTEDSHGIRCGGDYNTISGNTLENIQGGLARGIYVTHDHNAIQGNVITDVQATAIVGYGIHTSVTGDFNTIIGNILVFISDNEIYDEGTGNVVAYNL